MNAVLLTIMCTLALPYGSNAVEHNQAPCERNDNNNAFDTFLQRHILEEDFDRNSALAWTKYLKKKSLCHRPEQSFILKDNENAVVQICNGSGSRVRDNLCVSDSTFEVYDIEVNTGNCELKNLVRGTKRVIVACDKIDKTCLPVHFERYREEKPTAGRCHG